MGNKGSRSRKEGMMVVVVRWSRIYYLIRLPAYPLLLFTDTHSFSLHGLSIY